MFVPLDELESEANKVIPSIGYLGWRQKLTLMSAREKSGKSSFIGMDALEVAKSGFKVCWVAAEEDTSQVASRLITELHALDFPEAAKLIYISTICPKGFIELKQEAKKIQPDIIYVDTFSSFLALTGAKVPEPSDNVTWQAMVAKFKEIAMELNCAVVILHHNNKEDTSHGSVGITAAPDCLITFRRVHGHKELAYTPRFRIPDLKLYFRWDQEAFTYFRILDETPRTQPKLHGFMKLVEYLKTKGPTKKQTALKELDVSIKTIQTWIKEGSEKLATRRISPNSPEVEIYLLENENGKVEVQGSREAL